MKKWYDDYTGFPYKHLGLDKQTGIDCFNLCVLILKEQCNQFVNLTTQDFCKIIDEDWYKKVDGGHFANFNNPEYGFVKVSSPKVYDIIIMSLGSTNVPNHCAMYVDNNKVLHTMDKHFSWLSPYGRYYKQYTTGIYRWKALNN